MNLYIALADHENGHITDIYGVFSTELKAREACEEEAGVSLSWEGDRATVDSTTCVVMLTALDEAI